MSHLQLHPAVSLTLWLTLALLGVALLGWYARSSRDRVPRRRRSAILTCMALTVLLPLLLLLNPTWLEAVPPPPGKPVITILLDATTSMSTDDASAGANTPAAATAASGKTKVVSRLERGRQIAADMAAQLASQYDVRIRRFTDVSQPVAVADLQTITPSGDVTDLTAGVNDTLAEEHPQGQGILLLSDGVHNAGPVTMLRDAASRAKAANTPIFTFLLGGAAGLRDLEISVGSSQELAFVGQKIPIRVRVRQRGDLVRHTKVLLQLGNQTVERLDVDLKPDAATDVELPVSQDKVGLYRYSVRVPAEPGEVTPLNNTATLLLRVIDQPVKVLLLEGKPYWDTKFLVRTLAQDPSIALTSVVRITDERLLERDILPPGAAGPANQAAPPQPPAKQPGDAAAAADAAKPSAAEPTSKLKPRTEKGAEKGKDEDASAGPPATAAGEPHGEHWSIGKNGAQWLADRGKLEQYQLILLGRESEVFLTDDAITQLKRWLAEDNGSLICFRGAPSAQLSQRLAALMPVRWQAGRESRFRVRLTESGQDLRWLPVDSEGDDPLSQLPSLSTASVAQSRPPLATVLAAGVGSREPSEAPVITYQSVGLGKVVVVEGAGMWRWAFLPREHEHADEVYPLLWRSLVRWLVSNTGLAPSQKMALRSDHINFDTGEPATATLLLRESETGAEPPKIELRPDPPGANAAAGPWPRVVTPRPSGEAPGVFHVQFDKLPEGRYLARVQGAGDDPTTKLMFDVRGNLRERLDVAARGDLMQLLATQSGGSPLETAAPAEVAKRFQQHLARTRPARVERSTAWDRWWVMAGVLAVWGCSWMLRRRSGLI